MTFDAHKNFAYSTVATAPSTPTAGTSLVVASGHGTRFPAVPFNATIWAAGEIATPANSEIVRVTAISTDTLTIVRAQETADGGPSARTVLVGDQIAATITNKTLKDIEQTDGWMPQTDTWTYASATTFTIAGDFTGVLQAGMPIALTQTTQKYFYITQAPTYSSPNTTVTISGGTDYTLANAAITSPKISRVRSPFGFPSEFYDSGNNSFFSFNGKELIQHGTQTTTCPNSSAQVQAALITLTVPYSSANYSISTMAGPGANFGSQYEGPLCIYTTYTASTFRFNLGCTSGSWGGDRDADVLWKTVGRVT